MIRVRLLNDHPLSAAFGGKEIQLFSYMKWINSGHYGIELKLFNWWDPNELEEVDIIHLFGCGSYLHFLKHILAKYSCRVIISPTLYSENNWKFGRIPFLLGKFIPIPNLLSNINNELELSDAIIVNSESEKQFILRNILNHNNIFVIYNSIEDDFNSITPEGEDLFVSKFGLDRFSYILSVGMLDERKNTLNLIKAFLEVHAQIKKKLVLIGSPRFRRKEVKSEVMKLIEKNKDKIILIPYIDRQAQLSILKSAYFNSAFHVLPSLIETPGLSNLEAMYFGKACVVGRCKPVEEYFKDKAIYCNPTDLYSICDSILRCDKMGVFNKDLSEFIANKYVFSKQIPRLVKLYRTLCGYDCC